MERLTVVIILTFTLLFSQVTISQGQNLEERFDKVLNEQNFEDGPGFSVLIAKDGQVIYRKSFGYANLELDVKLKPEHIFRIGSITKQFTACAILKLEEEGKLSLQDDITKFIEDYPTHGHTITIEHLLTHVSGIKSVTSMKEATPETMKREFKTAEIIDFFKNEPMDFAPGEQYLYNNSAFIILGYIIEIITGLTYIEYLNEQFFEPLGMENTFYGSNTRIIKNRASGYQKRDGKLINAEYMSMTLPHGAGALISTVDDIKTWYYAVMNDKVISKENREKAHSSYKLNNGKPTGYGYGWSLGNVQEYKTVGHGGGINGYLTSSIFIPEKDIFVAVFSNCNCNPPGITALKLAAIAVGKPFDWKEKKVNKKELEEYIGVYESKDDGTRTLKMKNDSLMYVFPEGMEKRLIPFKKDKFFVDDWLTRFVFNRDKKGKIFSLTAYGTGYKPVTREKTDKPVEIKKDAELSEEQLEKYTGKYELMPDFILTISREGKRLFVQATGQSRGEIYASELHKFYSKDVNAQFIFNLNNNKKVIGLTLIQNGEHKAKKIE